MKPSEIKKIRTKLGLNQVELAKVLGFSSKTAVSNIETGFRKAGQCVENLLAVLNHMSSRRASEIVEFLMARNRSV